MPKIEYENPDDMKAIYPKRKNKQGWLVCLIVIISVIFGSIAGVGGIILLSENDGSLAKKLGFKNWDTLTIPLTETKKINVQESSAITEVAEKVSPAVVSIIAKSQIQTIYGSSSQESAGTGFIITSDGLILTNKHVVSDSSAAYTVITSDGKSYDATVQSADPLNDLAVIKISASGLAVVELGDSDDLAIGQWVVAIGNALGQYQNTVTAGVISAKQRDVQASSSDGSSAESLTDMLQTDTAINSGNSGGPLVNLFGQVIGINTAVASNAQGIGFAIPINSAKSAIDSIKKTGKIVRPYLGVRYLPITSDVAKAYNLKYEYGAYVVRGNGVNQSAVVSGSPANKAGIVESDIILEINGERIDETNSLTALLSKYSVGDSISVKIYHDGGEKTLKILLEEAK